MTWRLVNKRMGVTTIHASGSKTFVEFIRDVLEEAPTGSVGEFGYVRKGFRYRYEIEEVDDAGECG